MWLAEGYDLERSTSLFGKHRTEDERTQFFWKVTSALRATRACLTRFNMAEICDAPTDYHLPQYTVTEGGETWRVYRYKQAIHYPSEVGKGRKQKGVLQTNSNSRNQN